MDKTGLTEKKVTEKAKAVPFFPDEIITNILIKLPAKDAMRCRLVCRRWRDLTLNPDFVELHLRNSVPTILVVARNSHSQLQISELDKWWEPATMANDTFLTFVDTAESSYTTDVLFSHAGLIVLLVLLEKNTKTSSFEKEFVILNPARPIVESVNVTFSEELQGSEIYGVYYHPSLEGYCSLWKIGPSHAFLRLPDKFQYKILSLGCNPSLKTICNPFSNRVMMEDAAPLLINNYLYWKLQSEHGLNYDGHNDIMKFDIIREEFMVIHCPVPLNTECKSSQTHMLSSEGFLYFLLVLPNKITIWRLEDHAEQVWTTIEYTFNTGICDIYEEVGVIAVVDGKLALQLYGSGALCVCNLMEGTAINYPDFAIPATFTCYYSHQMSLASLSNSKTTIFIDQGDKVAVTT